jgi:glycosyltransferase involved in cell wall biosynthesis
MITVYTIAFNEEVLIKFMIDHYRSRFPNCHIVVYDNFSTDNTAQIAKDNNCEVIYYDTNNMINDNKYIEIKNNCWKGAKTDWVLVCDVDEMLEINQEQLLMEESSGTTIIKGEGYNMVNMEDNFDLPNITYGSRCTPYDKSYLFNKKFITDIRYIHGCHSCNPIGTVKYNTNVYKAYHYNCINPDYKVERYKLFASRLSPENKQHGWGYQYLQSEESIRQSFIRARSYVTKIKEK